MFYILSIRRFNKHELKKAFKLDLKHIKKFRI